MAIQTVGLCILLVILNATIKVLASPGSDWFEEEKRKADEKFANFDKDFDEQWNKQQNTFDDINKKWEERKKQME